MKKTRIIIASTRPVGVVTALACAQYGFAATLLEAESAPAPCWDPLQLSIP